jgi:hypothetical protein
VSHGGRSTADAMFGAGVMPSPGGRQFLILSPRAMEGPIELRIILNWF